MDMQDQTKFGDPEELITCPYNKVHNVTRKRMAFHLEKCRKQHPEEARQMKDCPFNIVHKIPRPEYSYHLENCGDRHTIYTHNFKVGQESNSTVQALMDNITVPLDIPCTEDWDTDDIPQGNIIEQLKENAVSRGVFQNYMNDPPAVRKMKREEDRRRIRDKLNKEEISKMDLRTLVSSPPIIASAENSKYGDTSSEASFATAKSDSVFHTKLDSAIDDLSTFQLVENKKRKGRGRPKSPASAAPVIVGRGRGIQRK